MSEGSSNEVKKPRASTRERAPQRVFRDLFSSDREETVVFAADVLAQPKGQRTLQVDPHVHLQCARALPIAREQDIVILTGPLSQPYHEWLRSHGYGPAQVVSYASATPAILSECIRENPSPVREAIAKSGRKPVYVPYYCSESEQEVARLLDASLFGSDPTLTRRFFNKSSFKEECLALGIPMVEGAHHEINAASALNQAEMAEIVRRLLSYHGRVIIRGTEDSNARSLFLADSPDIQELYNRLIENADTSVLIEPFLNVISSPNAQWCIDRAGKIHFIGITAQFFQGFKWAGNFSGQYYSPRVYGYIRESSKKIAEEMARRGYRGIMGIDYIVCEEGIFPIENNARLTGSSFAIALTDEIRTRLPGVSCWKFFKARTAPCSFEELLQRIDRVVYNGERTNCVFPFMVDQLGETGTFIAHLCAEDMYHIDYLQDALGFCGVTRD